MKRLIVIVFLLSFWYTRLQAQVIADFESSATTPIIAYGTDASIVDNPDKIGNSSPKVVFYRKENTNWKFIAFDFKQPISIKQNDILSFKVRSSTKGRVYPKLWLGQTLVSEGWAVEYNFMPEPNKWTLCTYDLSKVLNKTFDRIELATSVDNEAEAMVFIDDIKLSNSKSPNGEPVASLKVSTTKARIAQELVFDASDSYNVDGGSLNATWEFGDGTSKTGLVVNHKFDKEGEYKVRLKLTNTDGLFSSKEIQIYVFQPNENISEVKWLNDSFLTNQKIEGSFQLFQSFKNNYNPDEVLVDAEIKLSDGRILTIPCFYYIKGFYENNLWKIDSSSQGWRLRFSSPIEGRHEISIKINANGIKSSSKTTSLQVSKSQQKGIIKQDPKSVQLYRHTTGEPYYPLGINVAWNTTTNYATIIGNLANSNANLVRYWQVPFNRQALEWKNDGYTGGIGVYSQQAAAMQDSIINLAQKNNINLQLVLFQHGMFSENVNSNWIDNPYNANLNGPLKLAEEFFYNESAKKSTKKLLRYIVSRWGYSPNVFAWELFNEVNFTGVHNAQSTAWKNGVLQWHQEMGTYIKEIDAFKHIVTTSADDNQLLAMDNNNGLDVLQYHIYSPNLLAALKSQNIKFKNFLIRKGIIAGEYGEDLNTADVPFEKQRVAIWTGIMSQVPHLMWKWENYANASWSELFRTPARFLENKDFLNEGTIKDWLPKAKIGSQELSVVGMNTPESYHAVLYNETNQNRNTNGKLTLEYLRKGRYDLTYIDIKTGSISALQPIDISEDLQELSLPEFSAGLVVSLEFKAELIPLSIQEQVEDLKFNVMPNPNTGLMTIDFNPLQATVVQIQVIDLIGKIVGTFEYQTIPNQGNSIKLDLSNKNLPTGLYLMNLQLKEKKFTKRIIYLNSK